jgi:putative addiction module CopG family antidote
MGCRRRIGGCPWRRSLLRCFLTPGLQKAGIDRKRGSLRLAPTFLTPRLEDMEVRLTPDQEAFVRQAIETGRFQQAEDAVREALSLWEARERKRAEILAALIRRKLLWRAARAAASRSSRCASLWTK